jgi:hypothetical protein
VFRGGSTSLLTRARQSKPASASPWKQPRADQTGCSGEKNGSQDDPFH